MGSPDPSFALSVRVGTLRAAVVFMSDLVEETLFEVSPRGIKSEYVDASHVAFASVEIPSSAFRAIAAVPPKGEKGIEVLVDLNRLKRALKHLMDDDVVEVAWPALDDEGKRRENTLATKSGFGKRTVHVEDRSGWTRPRTPKLDFSAVAEVPTKALRTALSMAEDMTDHVTLTAGGHRLLVLIEGESEEVEAGWVYPGKRIAEKPVKSVFPLDYLTTLLRHVDAETVTVRLGNEAPMRVEFPLAGGSAFFIIAPRIEDD